MDLSNIIVHIDTREKKFNVEKIIEILNENKIESKYLSTNPGDFSIIHNGNCIYMFERKEIGDFLSSIKSGHFHEQRNRMLKDTGLLPNQLYIIIEGFDYKKISDYNLYQSVLTSTIQLGIKVVYTQDIIDTANVLLYTVRSMIKHTGVIISGVSAENLNTCAGIPNIKKKNIEPDEYYIACLQLIPGISINVANNIIKEYPSMNDLITKLKLQPDCLVPVLHPGKKSKKLAETVYIYLKNLFTLY